MSAPKPRPYLRSCRNLNEKRTEKPRFRLVKIDTAGRRRATTIELVNETSLPAAIRAFLAGGAPLIACQF